MRHAVGAIGMMMALGLLIAAIASIDTTRATIAGLVPSSATFYANFLLFLAGLGVLLLFFGLLESLRGR